MKKILLTGFTPFDGREQNASWIAARALAATSFPGLELRAVLIPVCWGAPGRILDSTLAEWQPDGIISMGEGEAGVFRLETVARNTRRERPDNDGLCPEGERIETNGPESRTASADCAGMERALAAQGIPVKLSADAGAFLCEELLYTLEGLRVRNEFLHTVLFVHLPPYGTELHYRNQPRICDEPLLVDFGQRLLQRLVTTDI
ncbi:MAG: hypothetical protein Q8L60_06460 [Gammaproteobacteria bacterium]|nr:hypothetical protein [Gammaproteobacteria bacterium]MDP2142058.1 hypothetical protein [Gammaproteobacteria bacterium]MDP2348363.1 hypothetical protein [Gammaproteobacteria bacterium]